MAGVVFATASALAACATSPKVGNPANGPDIGIISIQGFHAEVSDKTTMAFDFFDRFHVFPGRFDIGVVTSAQLLDIEIYSAHRYATYDWSTFVNNADPNSGITLVTLPTLPVSIPPQTSYTPALQLSIASSGNPIIDSTLDFGFTTPETVTVPITLSRVAPIVFRPEQPYRETLSFGTAFRSTITRGREQRVSYRKNPRQLFEWRLFLEDGTERTKVAMFLHSPRDVPFAIPAWHDLTTLTAAVTAGATVLPVANTSQGDFRVDGLVLIYKDSNGTFEILSVASLTATTVTLNVGLTGGFAQGDIVAPVLIAALDSNPSGARWPSSDAVVNLALRVTDNDANIGSTAAWPTFNGRVLLDECNGVETTAPELFEQDVLRIDSRSGPVHLDASSWGRSQRVTEKTFRTATRSASWNLRQLLYALRGPAVAFYLPSFSNDLQVAATVTNATSTIDVTNVGYTRFVGATPEAPRNIIRLVFVDGSAPVYRTVTAATEVSATVERLTVNSAWGATYTTSQIRRIEFVELVRFDSDDLELEHRPSGGVTLTAPVRSLFA